jgi:putative hemolysin
MIPVYTILVVVSVGVQAFFTASEMAFTSVNRMRLRALVDAGDKRAIALMAFLEKEGDFLGTTLTGTNISVVISSALATRIFAEYVGAASAAFFATLCMVPVTLVLAEIVPKMISHQFSTEFAMAAFAPIEGFHGIFKPIISLLNGAARFMLRPFGGEKTTLELTLTKSDLRNILLMGHETGGVDSGEVELIHKILEFGSKNVGNIMVPLYRVSSVNVEDTAENLKKLVAMTGFSRLPAYRENKKNIAGVVNVYDILFSESSGKDSKAGDFMREAVTVNSSDGLDIALARLRHREQPMGIVIDEKGNAVGMVTIEDILEEIVGDIRDSR